MEFIKTFFIFIVLSLILTPIGGIIYLIIKFSGKSNNQPVIIIQQADGTIKQMQQPVAPTEPIKWKRILIGVAIGLGIVLNYYFLIKGFNP